MKDFCVDLEIAKELKENGFPQESEFYWNIHKAGGGAFPLDDNLNKKFASYQEKVGMNAVCYATYSTPCSDEILKELPKEITQEDGIFHLNIEYYTSRCEVQYQCFVSPKRDYLMNFIEEETLPNALAKIWLYLKKEGYIK